MFIDGTHYDFIINDIKNDIKVQEKVATVRKNREKSYLALLYTNNGKDENRKFKAYEYGMNMV